MRNVSGLQFDASALMGRLEVPATVKSLHPLERADVLLDWKVALDREYDNTLDEKSADYLQVSVAKYRKDEAKKNKTFTAKRKSLSKELVGKTVVKSEATEDCILLTFSDGSIFRMWPSTRTGRVNLQLEGTDEDDAE